MKKKLSIAAIIIIIIGIIVVIAKGFNVDLRYKAHQSVSAAIGSDYNIDDIKSITDEIFGKEKVQIEKSGIYEDNVYIIAEEVSDEQLKNIQNKLNEKYDIEQNLLISMGETEYTVEDVQAIANEVFAKEDTEVEKYEDDETYVSIKANLVSEDEIETLNNKINEKYELTNESSSISVSNIIEKNDVPRVRLTDMAKQYVLFVGIATVIVLIYFVLRFRKLGVAKVLAYSIILSAGAELLYMAIIAITRYPIDKISMIAALALYIIILTYVHQVFCKEIAKSEKKK